MSAAEAISMSDLTRLDAGLCLPATGELPRQMQVELSRGGRLYAHIYAPGGGVITLAAADAWMADATLAYSKYGPFLHVDSALFRLTESEAAEIERAFAPLGLRITRKGSQT